jgi:hypothetical protein
MVPSSGMRDDGPYPSSGGVLGIRGATETDLELVLVGLITEENEASTRLAEKTGFQQRRGS